MNREDLGRVVREAWIRWAETRPEPKPSWLVPWDLLPEPDKEADRQIGEAVAGALGHGCAFCFNFATHELEWSDRHVQYCEEHLAEAAATMAFDHWDNRGSLRALPDSIRCQVQTFLDDLSPRWECHTVVPTPEGRERFLDVVRKAQKRSENVP